MSKFNPPEPYNTVTYMKDGQKVTEPVKKKPSPAAMNAAKKWIHPLAGDYIQEQAVQALAKVIDEEFNPVFDTYNATINSLSKKVQELEGKLNGHYHETPQPPQTT